MCLLWQLIVYDFVLGDFLVLLSQLDTLFARHILCLETLPNKHTHILDK